MDGEALLAQATAALPSSVLPSIREDVLNEIVLALLSGKELTRDVVRGCVQEVTRNTLSPWGTLSWDAPLPGHAGDPDAASLGDFISGDSLTGTLYGKTPSRRKKAIRKHERREHAQKHRHAFYRRGRYSPTAVGVLYGELDRQIATLAAALNVSKADVLAVSDETEGYEYRRRAHQAQRTAKSSRYKKRIRLQRREVFLTLHHSLSVHERCAIYPVYRCRCDCAVCSTRRDRITNITQIRTTRLMRQLEEQTA